MKGSATSTVDDGSSITPSKKDKKGQSRSSDLLVLVETMGFEPTTSGLQMQPLQERKYELAARAEVNSLLSYRTCVLFGVCANYRKWFLVT